MPPLSFLMLKNPNIMSEMNIVPAAAQNENEIKLSTFGNAIYEAAQSIDEPASENEHEPAENDEINVCFDAYDAVNVIETLLESIEGIGERAERGEVQNVGRHMQTLCDLIRQITLQM